MRKAIIMISTILSLLIIVGQFGMWDSLLLFLLVGTIPGTSLSIPPLAMLGCIVLFSGLIALILVAQTEPVAQTPKKNLPKKRYSRI